MRLTQEQMIAAVRGGRMSVDEKRILIERIQNNDMYAKFAACGLHRRQTGAADAAIERYRNRA